MVQRYIDGRWGKTIERQRQRTFTSPEDAWFVDCGLQLGMPKPDANLLIPQATYGETITITADAAVFSAGDVDKILRAAGGKFKVKTYTDSTHVEAFVMREIPTDKLVPLLEEARVVSGDWTLATPVTSAFIGYPYEGLVVKVIADGNVLPDQTVVNGRVTLSEPASAIIVGFGYRALLKSLPPTVSGQTIEGVLKRPLGLKLRRQETRGLTIGADLDHLSPMKDRTGEPYSEPTVLRSGLEPVTIAAARFDFEGQFYIVSDEPMPATVLGYLTKLDLGDADG
jgi:hypothetical protein